MSIKNLILTTLCLLVLLSSKAQQMEIRPTLGIGTYSMSALKDMVQESVSESPFDLKTTENFPPYLFYRLDIIHYVNAKLGWGFTGGFYSTGARNHYADYSGFYKDDMRLRSINIGLLLSQKVPLGGKFFSCIEFSTGPKFSKMIAENEVKIGEEYQTYEGDAKSLGWWVEPEVRIGRLIKENHSIAFFAGYEFMLINNIGIAKKTFNYNGPDINWSGLRAGVSISFINKD